MYVPRFEQSRSGAVHTHMYVYACMHACAMHLMHVYMILEQDMIPRFACMHAYTYICMCAMHLMHVYMILELDMIPRFAWL